MAGSQNSISVDLELTDTRPVRLLNIIIYNNTGGSIDVRLNEDPNGVNTQLDMVTCADTVVTRRNYKGGMIFKNGLLVNDMQAGAYVTINYEYL